MRRIASPAAFLSRGELVLGLEMSGIEAFLGPSDRKHLVFRCFLPWFHNFTMTGVSTYPSRIVYNCGAVGRLFWHQEKGAEGSVSWKASMPICW